MTESMKEIKKQPSARATLLSAALAALSAAALPWMLPLPEGSTVLSNSILCLPAAALLFCLIRLAMKRLDRRLAVFSLAGGFLLALALSTGRQIAACGHVALTLPNLLWTLLAAAAFTPALAAALALLLSGLPGANSRMRALRLEQSGLNVAAMRPVPAFCTLFGALLLSTAAAFLIRKAPLTLPGVLGALAATGLFALAIAYAVRRFQPPFLVTLLLLAGCALLPPLGMIAAASPARAAFSGAFLLLLLQAYDGCTKPLAFFSRGLRVALYLATVAACCPLSRGMPCALLVLLPFFLLGAKEKRLFAAALTVASVLLALAIGRLCPALPDTDGAENLLAVPEGQLSAVLALPEGALTEPERAELQNAVSGAETGTAAAGEFLGVWAAYLPRYLNEYTDAFLSSSIHAWYPDGPAPEDTGAAGLAGLTRVPLLALAVHPGFACWLLFLAVLALLYYRQYRLLFPLALPYGLWLTMLLMDGPGLFSMYPVAAVCALLPAVLFNGREGIALTVPGERGPGKDGRGAEVLRFTVAGGIGFLLDYGCMILFKEAFGFHYLAATGLSFVISVVVNYFLCAYWVFQGADTKNGGVKAGFLLTSLIGLGLNELIMLLLVDLLHIHYMLAKLVAVALVMIWNYFSKRRVLTHKKKPTEDAT